MQRNRCLSKNKKDFIFAKYLPVLTPSDYVTFYFNAGFIALKKSGPLYKACSCFKFESFSLSDETSHDFESSNFDFVC